MHFEFSTAARIIFGPGTFNSIGKLVRGYGNQALILYNGSEQTYLRAVELLTVEGVVNTSIRVENEPTVEGIQNLLDITRSLPFNLIVGIGGGSCLDTAKALSAFRTNSGDVLDYLEVIGSNKQFSVESIPVIAVPTTAGTGSEVTKNAVLGSSQQHIKVSLRSPYLLPRIALVDPELTLSLPPMVTIFTGLDALTQLIEAYTCNIPNPITDALSLEGIRRVSQSIWQVYENGDDINSRESMCLASLFSGISLANAKLGAVHGLAGPLGGELNAPHGAICACLLPYVMEANTSALSAIDSQNPAIIRYERIAKALLHDDKARISDGYQWIRNLCVTTGVPGLSTYGLDDGRLDKIIENAKSASSMKGNPVTLSDEELRNILYKAL